MRLVRLGNVRETYTLVPQADGSLLAKTVVGEPHSFDVEVLARVDGKALRWTYDSYEGRTTIAAKIAEDSGIRVAPAKAGVIADEHEVQGLLTPVEGRVANIAARFPGPIRRVTAHVGDSRIVDKPYGKLLWRGLPPFARTRDVAQVLGFFNRKQAPGAPVEDAEETMPSA